jgi:hypothetical protein
MMRVLNLTLEEHAQMTTARQQLASHVCLCALCEASRTVLIDIGKTEAQRLLNDFRVDMSMKDPTFDWGQL